MKTQPIQIGPASGPSLPAGLRAVLGVVLVMAIASMTAQDAVARSRTQDAVVVSEAQDTVILRYAVAPAIVRLSGGLVEWSAAVDCAPPVSLASLIGARVVFTLDDDLDGAADAVDSLGIDPADCGENGGESEPGRVRLRRRFSTAPPATAAASVLRADLRTPAGVTTASHALLTAGTGSLLAVTRYCARPQNGEPEWIEVRNKTRYVLPLAKVRIEGRALAGTLDPGESFTVGSDTAELRIWQPGARAIALSSWSNLRNSGDTLRVTLDPSGQPPVGIVLDSIGYGPAAHPSEDCASLAGEGSAAAAAGYALELPSRRWRLSEGGAGGGRTSFTITVRAPESGVYDLRVYDLDGRELCAPARRATGPGDYTLPHPACAVLEARAGTVILHLAPRADASTGSARRPGVRAVIRITE